MGKRNACIVAAGVSNFGERQAHFVDLFQEASKKCFDDLPGLNKKDVDGLLVATSLGGRTSTQINTAPVIAERLGLKPTAMCTRIDTLCAGGNSGIILAKGLVESGIAEMVMVAGGEKLFTPQKWEIFYSEINVVDHDWDGANGLGLPSPFFAMHAKDHMKRFGTTKEQLAAVSVANYNFGSINPYAQYQRKLTLQEALEAPIVTPPLSLYDCCPITDGAACCIITTEEKAKEISGNHPLVYIRGTAQASVSSVTSNWPGEYLSDWPHLRLAVKRAFEKAEVTAADIDVAQTHDCFTISQVIEVEEFGWCKKGEGGPFVAAGQTCIGGKIPVNTDGGLLACGHPFGATGIRQATEIMKQLQGRATFQVKDAAIGLAHNLSGLCAEHTIVVYGREPVK
jgi:acetyl-CoA C-acetyltransferase